MASIKVDPDALRTIGTQLKASAGTVAAKKGEVARLQFGSGEAGTIYGAEGAKVGTALGRFSTWLTNWSAGIETTGTNIVTSADAYTRTQDETVAKFKVAEGQLS